MKKTILLSLAAVALVGCAQYPKTKASFGPLVIDSGKNVTIGSANIQLTNGVPTSIVVSNYCSTNDPEIIRIISQAQTELTKNYLDTMNRLAELGKALAK